MSKNWGKIIIHTKASDLPCVNLIDQENQVLFLERSSIFFLPGNMWVHTIITSLSSVNVIFAGAHIWGACLPVLARLLELLNRTFLVKKSNVYEIGNLREAATQLINTRDKKQQTLHGIFHKPVSAQGTQSAPGSPVPQYSTWGWALTALPAGLAAAPQRQGLRLWVTLPPNNLL